MYIEDIIWLDRIVEKLDSKHHVASEEVEEVLANGPRVRKAQKGHVKGEDLYYAYGRTYSGRYLFVVFLYKRTNKALIISARDMDKKERKYYGNR